MQTFLPFSNFHSSAAVLDRQRLGKQRVETLQIMTALMTGTGWVNHPATLMWRKYEWALLEYQRAICREWTERGYSDTYFDKTEALYVRHRRWLEEREWPNWLGQGELHLSHQSNLLRKDYTYYAPYFPSAWADMEYIWPPQLENYKKLGPSPWWNPPDPPY